MTCLPLPFVLSLSKHGYPQVRRSRRAALRQAQGERERGGAAQ